MSTEPSIVATMNAMVRLSVCAKFMLIGTHTSLDEEYLMTIWIVFLNLLEKKTYYHAKCIAHVAHEKLSRSLPWN